MWVRDQDKTCLVDTNEFKVEKTAIWGYSRLDTNGYELLGQYETEERAIEVLDKIQKHLVVGSRYDTLHSGRRDLHEKVFNMPQK